MDLAISGPDGNSGVKGNSGGSSVANAARLEIAFGPGGWRSPKSAGISAIDQRNS
ncbi:hypothetical protein [Nocardia sp. NPDC055049]